MKLNLGRKIRSMRLEKGITQERLAAVLGVSNQAVSRWESDAGYPDTELLPSIANYFGISMDELFSFSDERERKIKNIMDRADEFLNAQGDMTECINILRDAVREFPNNAKLLVRLGYSLNMDGWKKNGCYGYVKDGSDYTEFDGLKNQNNEPWLEAVSIFEKLLADPVLSAELPHADYNTALTLLITQYEILGFEEKAVDLAKKQHSLLYSREILLASCSSGEDSNHFLTEVISLLSGKLLYLLKQAQSNRISLSIDDKINELSAACAELNEILER